MLGVLGIGIEAGGLGFVRCWGLGWLGVWCSETCFCSSWGRWLGDGVGVWRFGVLGGLKD